MAQNETTQTGNVAIISTGIVITGNVECEGAMQISGRINGEVRCPTVFVDEGGIVDGAIEAERLRVAGVVNGSVTVDDLAVEAGGTVSAETSYERVKIASGGIITGSFTHRAKPQTGEGDASLKLVTQKSSDNPRRVYVD